ncbi:unnamed protein product [Staurois parvus]|uniref:Uncharacterized protein n=1 Tax=Staurois parvus TaxID=386267 RepID=A0ABN9AZ07_9NEOB|nr:unnamed protein product [Staurois parvus]
MTRDCGQSTGDDQETADIVQGMTRDCGPLGREGERVPEFDRYPLPLPLSCLPSSSRAGFCDSRVPTAHV